MTPEATRIVFEFQKMPSTPEKEELARRYCSDEINIFDFLPLAEKYILDNKEKQNDHQTR